MLNCSSGDFTTTTRRQGIDGVPDMPKKTLWSLPSLTTVFVPKLDSAALCASMIEIGKPKNRPTACASSACASKKAVFWASVTGMRRASLPVAAAPPQRDYPRDEREDKT